MNDFLEDYGEFLILTIVVTAGIILFKGIVPSATIVF